MNVVSTEIPGLPSSETSIKKEGLLTLLLGLAVVLVIMNTAMFNLALPDVTETFWPHGFRFLLDCHRLFDYVCHFIHYV
ncbi:hypothetical protein HMSSN036_77380 [Paenibacillus macerans]|nr:hypothetical protein HMSSN036_77380 [Paenibacillus macerans]